MRAQQLGLCLLACLVCCAFASRASLQGYEDDGYYNRPPRNGYDKHEGYHGGHEGYDEGYDRYDDGPHGPPPSQCRGPGANKTTVCGTDTFKDLTGNTCIDPYSGVCGKYDNTTCKVTTESWCKQIPGTNFSCTYEYKHRGKLCRPSAGDCDEADYCNGTSAACPDKKVDQGELCRPRKGICDKPEFCDGGNNTCPTDKVEDKGTLCHAYNEGPCILDSECDGVSGYCPGKKKAPTGTPCNEHGLYEEAEDGYGKVALMSADGKYVEKKHGWSSCHRCYKGQCKHFKFEWWKKEKKPKHKDHDEGKYDDDKYDDDKYGDDKYSYEEEEYYPTKGHAQAELEGYEPEFYCRPRSK